MYLRTALPILLGCLAIQSITASKVTVDFEELNESSGVACSTRYGGLLFSHNDSGDKARLFAFNEEGEKVYELEVEKARARDWEDMCAFEQDGEHWLAVGDIGDNEFARKSVSIYVMKEPKEKADDRKRKSEVEYELKVEYPDGPINSEAMAYDPIRKSFLILSKENINCMLFEVPIPEDPKGDMEVKAKLIGSHLIPLVTGADISRDGKRLAICTYGPACIIPRNEKDSNEPWKLSSDALSRSFFQVPARRQGEAICFSSDAKNLWLTSEFAPTPLLQIPTPAP